MNREILEKAIKDAGGVSALSNLLGIVSPSSIHNWRSRGIPDSWAKVITLMQKDDLFPKQVEYAFQAGGMTLRDYFATKALHAACSRGWARQMSFENVAKECYQVADAMMKERVK